MIRASGDDNFSKQEWMSSAQNCLKLKNIAFCKWLNNYEGVD